jgi:inorganic pyrophosphatase
MEILMNSVSRRRKFVRNGNFLRSGLFLLSFLYATGIIASDKQITPSNKFIIQSDIHLIHDVNFSTDNVINAVIEISAGSTEKWEIDNFSGKIRRDFEKESPRVIKFLPYPGNYGLIPQTFQDKSLGGDGDALDIIVLSNRIPKGSIVPVRVMGSMRLLDDGETDDKYIAVLENSKIFQDVKNISEMMIKFPGSIQIVRLWFEGYKKNKIQFVGYHDRDAALKTIHFSHLAWKASRGKR